MSVTITKYGDKKHRVPKALLNLISEEDLWRELYYYERMQQRCLRRAQARTLWLTQGGRSINNRDPNNRSRYRMPLQFREDPYQIHGWERNRRRLTRGLECATLAIAAIEAHLNERQEQYIANSGNA